MMLFRQSLNSDINDIYTLAKGSGIGLTTLSKDIEILKKRLALSTVSFAKTVNKPQNEQYFFVLEDTLTKKVIGTSAIKAINGYDQTAYTFQIVPHQVKSASLNKNIYYETLHIKRNALKSSEICTLYLDPHYRHSHNGLLLSRARFLFIAQNPARFTKKIIAEMRGVANEEGQSPFWQAVGQHFFDLSFAQADRLSSLGDKQFIEDLIPNHPIYVNLLDKAAQEVIGKPHPLTVPAMNILLKEGFTYKKYVDIFDAGPNIEAIKSQIRTINNSQVRLVKHIISSTDAPLYLLASISPYFRATMARVDTSLANEAIIDQETADLLHLKCGDYIRISSL